MRQRLVALILSLVAQSAYAETLAFIGLTELATESVMGVSGLEVSDDGLSFVAVSDRGWWLRGSFDRSEAGVIETVNLEEVDPIIGQDGLPVSARRVGDWSDAEGLAIDESGQAWVAFERWTHVWSFENARGVAQFIKDHPTFYDYSDNWQLEAAAVSPEGTVYVIPEKPLLPGFPLYRLDDRKWVIDQYLPERDVFSITGADFDQNGDLYILERRLIVGIWWQNRIRRVRLDGSEDRILWTGDRGEFNNLEGIALWRDDLGLRLTLVSDNNGMKDEATQFVEFRLTE